MIIPVFNGEQFIEEAVQSVLRQTFADFELIAVDDGSTDRTLVILEELAAGDDRVVVLRRSGPGPVRRSKRGSRCRSCAACGLSRRR